MSELKEDRVYILHVQKLNKEQKIHRIVNELYIPSTKHNFTLAAKLVGRELRIGVAFAHGGIQKKDSYNRKEGAQRATERLEYQYISLPFEGNEPITGADINQSLNALANQIDNDPAVFRVNYGLADVAHVSYTKLVPKKDVPNPQSPWVLPYFDMVASEA